MTTGQATNALNFLDVGDGLHVPTRQMHKREGIIRWAVGSPEGPRSQTWVLVGRPDASIYIAPREQMHDIKLSLHPVKWRMAFTEEAAVHRLGLGPDDNRLIQHWEKPAEMRPGWRHAACVTVAMSNLGAGYDEKKPKKGRIGWFSPVPPACSIRFDILIGEPGYDHFAMYMYADVGGIDFDNGWKVWVIASANGPSEENETRMAELRYAVRQQQVYGLDDRTWVWGESGEDRSPLMFDLSNLAPSDTPRNLDVRSIESSLGIRTITIPVTQKN